MGQSDCIREVARSCPLFHVNASGYRYLHRSHHLQDGLLALVPGDAFGAPKCVRISYAASMEVLEKAIDRLEGSLGKISRQ